MADSLKVAGTGAARAVGRTAGAAASQGSDLMRIGRRLRATRRSFSAVYSIISTQAPQAGAEAAPNLAKQVGPLLIQTGTLSTAPFKEPRIQAERSTIRVKH